MKSHLLRAGPCPIRPASRLAAAAAILWLAGSPAAAQLAIVNPVLHNRQEDGPSIPANYTYYGGELLYLSFKVSGFKPLKDQVEVRWQIVATDPDGVLLVPLINGAVREELNVNDKEWLPRIQQTIPLPPQIPPGPCRLKLIANDEYGKTTAEKELEFKVGGRPLPKVSGFTILDLGFYESDTAMSAMREPVYRQGVALWARFQMAGFALGEKNRFDVSYGLEIRSTEGKVLYERAEAASDGASPFYPRRLLNGGVTLDISSGVSPGEYLLVVKAKDRVGGAEAEAQSRFRVTAKE
jgi:hypothetical protein